MNEYIPPCKIYNNEDFEFSGEVVEVDEETGEVGIELKRNKRCDDCFLLEKCLADFNAIMEQGFELEEEEVDIPSGLLN